MGCAGGHASLVRPVKDRPALCGQNRLNKCAPGLYWLCWRRLRNGSRAIASPDRGQLPCMSEFLLTLHLSQACLAIEVYQHLLSWVSVWVVHAHRCIGALRGIRCGYPAARRNAPATAPGFRFRMEPILLGFLAGSAAAVGLATGGKLAEVVRAALGRHRASLAP